MKKYKYGIIGCGGITNGKHMPAIAKLKDVEMVAFCDIIKERAEKANEDFGGGKGKVYTDYKEMLKSDLDAVIVGTPNCSHCEITVAALNAGKNVLCEKPMAMNYEEAKKMLDAYFGDLTANFQEVRHGDTLSLGTHTLQFFLTPWAPDNEAAMQSQAIFNFYWFYTSVYHKCMFPKQPIYFEEVNTNTHTGYQRTLVVALKAEEALLNRAEAYALTNQPELALKDINVWTDNFVADSVSYNTYEYDENWNYIYATEPINKHLTMERIRQWAEAYDYYTPMVPRPRKHLNPEWTTLTEGSDQENLLQCILLMRRLEFLHEGMRWFDIKRFDIEVTHEAYQTGATDVLTRRDPRRAVQIPQEVISYGIAPNPR